MEEQYTVQKMLPKLSLFMMALLILRVVPYKVEGMIWMYMKKTFLARKSFPLMRMELVQLSPKAFLLISEIFHIILQMERLSTMKMEKL